MVLGGSYNWIVFPRQSLLVTKKDKLSFLVSQDSNPDVSILFKVSASGGKTAGPGVLPFVDSLGSNLGFMSLWVRSPVVTCLQVFPISTQYSVPPIYYHYYNQLCY